MQTLTVEADLTVVGGGLAGICAAIAAARQGARVALVQNRPVLGGNSSSEIRVWVCGATAHGKQSFARENGIMGELYLENQFRNPDGNPYYWDLVLLEAVRAEPNISLFLNTDVTQVEATGPEDARTIRSVTGWTTGSERVVRFVSPAYADCTGDGLVGYLAGARHLTGEEPRAMYGESWAPEEPKGEMLGSTILFYTKDVGRPVKFVPPSFARDIAATSIPKLRDIRTDANGCDYWWIEWGGSLDVVADNEAIRDELQAACYGIWDYIKNSGRFAADNLTLEWIGAIPGKREYRRFLGDYVLTQHDVLGQTPFADGVAFGGWSIDLHPAGGMYANERGSRHWHSDGPYPIPLRCLYSQNVANLWLAGRNISASHVAFGSTRVMATCAAVGEAAGIAAAMALREGLPPRELATTRFELVRRAMVRADSPVLGLRHEEPDDHALRATVAASSQRTTLSATRSDGTLPIAAPIGLVVPVDGGIDDLELLVDTSAPTEFEVTVHEPSHPQNVLPSRLVTSARITVAAGSQQWVRMPLRWHPEGATFAFLTITANQPVAVHTTDAIVPGTVVFTYRDVPPDEPYPAQWRAWKRILHRRSLCFRLTAPTAAFDPRKVIGGYARPWSGPQMWVSEPLDRDPTPWLELSWDAPVRIGEVALIFDDDINEDLINLHHHRTTFEVIPELVRDYRLEVLGDSRRWRTLAEVTGNRHRHRRHAGADDVRRLRLTVTATNGAESARVISFRAWA
jgi:FAD dependent oxidoreductase